MDSSQFRMEMVSNGKVGGIITEIIWLILLSNESESTVAWFLHPQIYQDS